MGVGLCCGSNNICRTLLSVCGGCIRLAGAGWSTGHTATPTVLQPEIASAKVSDSPISSLLCIRLVLFVLVSDGSDLLGLRMFGIAGQRQRRSPSLALRRSLLGGIGTKIGNASPRNQKAAANHQRDRQHAKREDGVACEGGDDE